MHYNFVFLLPGTREQIGEAIREGIFPQLMQLAQSADYDVKREANWAFVNAASGANPQQVKSSCILSYR